MFAMINSGADDDLQQDRTFLSLASLALSFSCLAPPARPYWDGSRVLFEINDGEKRVLCAISQAALEGLGERRYVGGAALVRCFSAAREGIEAIARDKLKAMPGGIRGTLNIWASDLDDLPPSGGSAEVRRTVQHLSA